MNSDYGPSNRANRLSERRKTQIRDLFGTDSEDGEKTISRKSEEKVPSNKKTELLQKLHKVYLNDGDKDLDIL